MLDRTATRFALLLGVLLVAAACDAGPGDPPGPPRVTIEVTGTVRAPGGAPAAGARVAAARAVDAAPLATDTTAADGRYALTIQVDKPDAPAELVLRADADGAATAWKRVSRDASLAGVDLVFPPFEGGVGTPEEPYRIATPAQLQAVRDAPGRWHRQVADIDLGAAESGNGGESFRPIGAPGAPFTGHFDGGGHAIRGLAIDRRDGNRQREGARPEDGLGLFGEVDAGTVVRVRLIAATVRGSDASDHVGLLVGRSRGGEIRDVRAAGTVTGAGAVGGLVGTNRSGTIANAQASVSVEGAHEAGGLVGRNMGTVRAARATGAVRTKRMGGGLIGVNGAADGGPAGRVDDAVATGDVSGERQVGGLVGGNYGAESEIRNAQASGAVTAEINAGGFVYDNSGAIRDAAAAGAVRATGGDNLGGGRAHTGGFAVYNDGDIVRSEATGPVASEGRDTDAGGLVGFNGRSGTIRASRATGAVAAPREGDTRAGGLVATNAGRVQSSYATGSVSAVNAGGLVGAGGAGAGAEASRIAASYATGSVTGTGRAGGVLAQADAGATLTATYWDVRASGQADAVGEGRTAGATGLPTPEMQGDAATERMAGFDFETVWRAVPEAYPALRWEAGQ